MDDLIICKEIAKIDGVVVYRETKDFYGDNYFRNDTHHDLAPVIYNPLTDDALCFQLSKKYNVSIMHYEEYSTARIWDDPEDNPIADFSNINNDTSLNKAICLAIIEAHKESNDE